MVRYPRICAHIIAESLGYATPGVAAAILKDATERTPNYCEWAIACYGGDAGLIVTDSIQRRHHHHGPMASYELALKLVRHEIDTGDADRQAPPLDSCSASW